jgi:hypothetical protein
MVARAPPVITHAAPWPSSPPLPLVLPSRTGSTGYRVALAACEAEKEVNRCIDVRYDAISGDYGP